MSNPLTRPLLKPEQQALIEQTRLVVFDWDGTIMDSTGRIVEAMQETARCLNLKVPTVEAVKGIIGLGLTECFETLFPDLSGHAEITEQYRYQYLEGEHAASPVFNGVEETLELLKNKGYLLGVATGKARHGLDRVLKESNLEAYFDTTIAADEANSKPHPEMLHTLMQRTNIKPQQTLMIGDTSFDLEMAQKAATHSIGVSFGAHSAESLIQYNPLAVIDNYTELRLMLKP